MKKPAAQRTSTVYQQKVFKYLASLDKSPLPHTVSTASYYWGLLSQSDRKAIQDEQVLLAVEKAETSSQARVIIYDQLALAAPFTGIYLQNIKMERGLNQFRMNAIHGEYAFANRYSKKRMLRAEAKAVWADLVRSSTK